MWDKCFVCYIIKVKMCVLVYVMCWIYLKINERVFFFSDCSYLDFVLFLYGCGYDVYEVYVLLICIMVN